MPKFEHITLIIESLPGARAQVQVNIPTPMPGMRLETPAHALAIDALGWLGKQPAVAGFVYGGIPSAQGAALYDWKLAPWPATPQMLEAANALRIQIKTDDADEEPYDIDIYNAMLEAAPLPPAERVPQPMTGQQRIEAIRRHHVRAGEIVDLACATATLRGDGDDLVCDLLDTLRRVGCVMHPSMQPLHRVISLMDDDYQSNNNECLVALSEEGLLGYAICFHAPASNPGDEPMFDDYYTTWIYAETIDAAWQHAIAWGDEVLARKAQKELAA